MISCDQSDYLEIACLYRIPIALRWADGRRIEGTPLDTGYNDQREECLQMDIGGNAEWVVLTGVRDMTALIDNPHFMQIEFGADGRAQGPAWPSRKGDVNRHCTSSTKGSNCSAE